jgi:hypothetical protein
LYKRVSLTGFSVVARGLDDIVGVEILDKAFQATALQDFGNEEATSFWIGHANALIACFSLTTADITRTNLFDHVGAELVAAQSADVSMELSNDGFDETTIKLQTILDDIVGKWIL